MRVQEQQHAVQCSHRSQILTRNLCWIRSRLISSISRNILFCLALMALSISLSCMFAKFCTPAHGADVEPACQALSSIHGLVCRSQYLDGVPALNDAKLLDRVWQGHVHRVVRTPARYGNKT